ncbi:MAG: hypothetical protein FJ118_02755 [Deltaproteobacteria bacterium]|nr:hypothetical protein [Deltaproteobacteria bacterium]
MKELLFASALLVSLPSILFAEQIIRDQTGRIIERRDTVGGVTRIYTPDKQLRGTAVRRGQNAIIRDKDGVFLRIEQAR